MEDPLIEMRRTDPEQFVQSVWWPIAILAVIIFSIVMIAIEPIRVEPSGKNTQPDSSLENSERPSRHSQLQQKLQEDVLLSP